MFVFVSKKAINESIFELKFLNASRNFDQILLSVVYLVFLKYCRSFFYENTFGIKIFPL